MKKTWNISLIIKEKIKKEGIFVYNNVFIITKFMTKELKKLSKVMLEMFLI